MALTTATYMGFRTKRYSPPMTSRSVGATGAGVPRPSVTKRPNARINTTIATAKRAPPTIIATTASGDFGHRTVQPLINHGSSPATIPGAATKKTVLPAAAADPRIRRPTLAGYCGDQ